jgi:hypothetical protein
MVSLELDIARNCELGECVDWSWTKASLKLSISFKRCTSKGSFITPNVSFTRDRLKPALLPQPKHIPSCLCRKASRVYECYINCRTLSTHPVSISYSLHYFARTLPTIRLHSLSLSLTSLYCRLISQAHNHSHSIDQLLSQQTILEDTYLCTSPVDPFCPRFLHRLGSA